jgi:hypothetical protein
VVWHKICETCGFHIPDVGSRINPFQIPCSEFHVRCIRCGWPTAKSVIDEDNPDLCRQCRGKQ